MALGRRYADGLGVAKSCDSAVAHYREAADAVAMTYDGVPNPTSRIVGRAQGGRRGDTTGLRSRDDEKMMQVLMYRADNGGVDAILALGHIYFKGQYGVPRDWQRARRYFLEALAKGEVAAYGALGQLYATGDSTAQPAIPRDFNTAASYFEEGVARNDAVSLNGMGYLHAIGYYSGGRPSPKEAASASTATESAETADAKPPQSDFESAAQYFTESAERGSAEGLYNLGVLLLHGRGVPQDPLAAIKQFEAAAQRGSVLSFWQLARHEYMKGNCARAVLLYAHVASFASVFDRSTETPYFPLGEESPSPLTPRADTTLVRFLEALALAETGHAASRQDAALMLDSLPLVEEVEEELHDGIFVRSGKPPDRAMQMNSGAVWLQWYHTPPSSYSTPADSADAGVVAAKPALLSQSEALKMLRLRLLGLWALTGDADADLRLGDFYYYGESRLIGVSMSRAFLHYEAAARKHNPKALFNMGLMYQLGLGVGTGGATSVGDAIHRILTNTPLDRDDGASTQAVSTSAAEAAVNCTESEEMRLYLAKRYYDRVVEVDPVGAVYAVRLALISLNFQWWWMYFSRQRYGLSTLLQLPMPGARMDFDDADERIADGASGSSSELGQGQQGQGQEQQQQHHHQQQQQQQQPPTMLGNPAVETQDEWLWEDCALAISAALSFVLLLIRHHGA
ncbi:hypothetical protein DQ04_06321000 [Trypanosoma grayi]|uniref:hypothetical protein n=1 Tax=Trypanosoma grayi TaxID=71804 RepID=UPI0004F3F122|nr:hypothetical protein DQ04_06321000 [Trypanosoma grayi]KEG08845.1 hypothetical protein DQ04_06321000 [Trypanosoma grayi]